jgi:hypothetical protein
MPESQSVAEYRFSGLLDNIRTVVADYSVAESTHQIVCGLWSVVYIRTVVSSRGLGEASEFGATAHSSESVVLDEMDINDRTYGSGPNPLSVG